MSERESLSGADNAWRRMGTPTNLMTITGVMMFDERMTYEDLCNRLEERLLRFERFQQRIGGRKRRFRQPYWETVDGFDVEPHVYHISLPEPKDKATFEAFVGKLMSRPLDESRPLWEAYLVDGAGPGEGNAVAFRLNHSIGDGFALLYVLLGLVDNPGDIELPSGMVSAPDDIGDDADSGADGDDGSDGSDVASGDGQPADGVSKSAETDADGSSGLINAAGTAATGVATGYDLLFGDDDPETSLRGELGQQKRAAWTDEIPLEQVRTVCEAQPHRTTINDVLLAALAGALRRLLEDRGESVDGVELHGTVPVNLKPMAERDGSLGNNFGLVFLPLPVGAESLQERISIIHEWMDGKRAGIQAFLMYALLTIGGHVPEYVQKKVMTLFEGRATGVVTNVPGPTDAISFAGREITDMIFWVPQANEQGIGISIFSYDGNVRVGVAADENLLGAPGELAAAFEAEMEALLEDVE